jgi:hypothetical protein
MASCTLEATKFYVVAGHVVVGGGTQHDEEAALRLGDAQPLLLSTGSSEVAATACSAPELRDVGIRTA